MAKYFTLDRIREAAQHLSQFDSKWLLPPFVFACNGVSQSADFVDIQQVRGSDGLLDKFFSGSLIGLPKRGNGDSLRPLFKEMGGPLSQGSLSGEIDVAKHQRTVLWGSSYSRNGYKEMVDRGELVTDGRSRWKLTPSFQPAFEANRPPDFKFEEFLVWLFAFRDIPDSANSWQELWNHFRAIFLGGDDIPPEYKGRFRIRSGSDAVPRPAGFLNQRPTDAEYQKALLPTEFIEQLTGEVWQDIKNALIGLAEKKYRGYDSNCIDPTHFESGGVKCQPICGYLVSTWRRTHKSSLTSNVP